ncbi:hypothetical protein M9H77_14382 [Catharanthus roseus]|uniref:Uncharacterized protein n=1 Tax=Catharanthus roseus TaxID=4058 RepID=A0ACC0BN14_CATRO|nr:hypothetical protein M9H77_14382 [Catharanthus roseus]
MLNYKEHPSKSSHSRPDENSLSMFFCTFVANISPAHKYLLSYHFLYKLQEHENKAMETPQVMVSPMVLKIVLPSIKNLKLQASWTFATTSTSAGYSSSIKGMYLWHLENKPLVGFWSWTLEL